MRNGRVPELKALLHRPSQPGGPDQPGLGRQLALGDETVMEGQLAGLQVAADQQAVPRGRGGDPGPGVPAIALRSLPGGADLPAPLALQQLLHRVLAGHPGSRGDREGKRRRDPQDVGLRTVLQELPQLRAAAVDLVPAGEVERQAVGVGVLQDIDGQLSLRPEPQVQGQAGNQRLHRVGDVLSRDPLPGSDQRVPGPFPHVGQVHRVDPVRYPPGAAHVLAFHPGRDAALCRARDYAAPAWQYWGCWRERRAGAA